MRPLTRWTLGLGAVAALGIGLAALLARRAPAEPKLWDGKPIPKGGFWTDPQGRNLGDPANAERDLRKMYKALVAFRARAGRLPTMKEFFDSGWVASHLGLTHDDLNNPDYKYSDGYRPSKNASTYGFAFLARRPDGTPKPSFPAPGERDVWVGCDDYLRNNQFVRDDASSREDLRGFALVLWSDGRIERIRNADRVMVQDSARSSSFTEPGQAGTPKRGISYAEYLRRNGVAGYNETLVEGRPL